jgi:hydrogenase maturation protein HypF
MVKILVRGVVQGVGFRPTVFRVAGKLGYRGYVKNAGSNVEICIDGDGQQFVEELKKALPTLARIEHYEFRAGKPKNKGFEIITSSDGKRTSPIPPDVAVCDQCLEELFDKKNRRHDFPFINCTDCGARFSVISDVPYDRKNTSMSKFKLCEKCRGDYTRPADRRFHAQTISCPGCGPSLMLHANRTKSPLKDFAEMLDKGAIGAMKSWGGAHIVCLPSEASRLRKRYNRPQKPFAVMVRSLKAAGKYAHISKAEERLLTSASRPIVLLRKKFGNWREPVAPGLNRVGLYLPYTAIQHLLFSHLKSDALIMTSGNIPGEPMAITNKEVLELDADIHMLHDREIINRIDDSVVLPNSIGFFFIRKSRGYVPEPLPLPHDKTLLAMGGDMNSTCALSVSGKGIMSQHIGDVSHYATSLFMEKAIRHLMKLYDVKEPDAVVVDMHPRYSSRRLGKELAEDFGVPLVQIQHHEAHAYALMAEHGLKKLRVLSCDGTGYGKDSAVWGGEMLEVSSSGAQRLGHLGYIPLLGGDKAVEDPRRVVFAITSLIGINQPYFKGRDERLLESMLERSVKTSSTGRILDALACWLGVCTKMTYDGEPAMKLESYMARGRPAYELAAPVKNGAVDTLELFGQLNEIAKPGKKLRPREIADISRSFTEALFEGMIQAARPRNALGFTGGVSYNLVINGILEKKLGERGIRLVSHCRVPNGDGGISFGQLVAGGLNVSGDSR